MKAKIIRNTLLSAGSSVVVGIVGFVLIPFMLRYLGPVAFGLVSLAGVFLSAYTGLLELGFQTAITRTVALHITRGEERAITEVVTTAALLFFAIGILTLVIGFAATKLLAYRVLVIDPAYRQSFEQALRLIFFSYLFQLPTLVFLAMLEGFQRFDITKGVQVAGTILTAAGTVLVLWAGYGYVSVIAVTVGASLVQFVLYVAFAYRLMPGFSLRFIHASKARLQEILKISRYIFLGKLSGLVYNESDRFLIGVTIGASYLAAYEVLFRLPRFVKSVAGLGTAAILPAATELHSASDLRRQQALFTRGLRFSLFFTIPIVTAAMFFAQTFLLLWVGPVYASLSVLLQLLLLWTLLSVISSYGGLFLISMDITLKESTYLAYAITAAKVLIVVVTIFKWKIAGVVVGNVLAFAIVLPFLMQLYLRALQLSWGSLAKSVAPLLWPIGASVLIAIVLTRFEQPNTFLLLAIHGIVWCACYWAITFALSLDKADREVITGSIYAFARP
jgi:O-antigen/teichoic acid export membrane protein